MASWWALGSRRVGKGNTDLLCTVLDACSCKNICVARDWICVCSPPPPPNIYAETLTPNVMMAFGGEAIGQHLGLVGVVKAGSSYSACIGKGSEAIRYPFSLPLPPPTLYPSLSLFPPPPSLPPPSSLPPEDGEMAAVPTPTSWEFQTLSSSQQCPGGIKLSFPCSLIQVSSARSPYWENKTTPALTKHILISKNCVPGSEVQTGKQHRPGSRPHQVHTLGG